jgi:hypothetical protein
MGLRNLDPDNGVAHGAKTGFSITKSAYSPSNIPASGGSSHIRGGFSGF